MKAEDVAKESGTWFCERGDFWGTINQLCLCAKCGKNEIKRHDEPRHYRGLFTPSLHTICDECFDSLPDDEPRAPLTMEKDDGLRNPTRRQHVPLRSLASARP